jgi:hypothetical protein
MRSGWGLFSVKEIDIFASLRREEIKFQFAEKLTLFGNCLSVSALFGSNIPITFPPPS